MKTEIEIVPQVTVPGVKIQAQQFALYNVHLHQFLLTLSRLMNGVQEMDFANSGAGMSRSEATVIWADWSRAKAEWQRALKFRDMPVTGGLETQYSVLLQTQNQMLSAVNVRAQRLLQALRNLAERVLSSDSAKQEFDIQTPDEAAIAYHISYCDEIVGDYVGTVSSEGFDRGLTIPAHTELGTVVPPESMAEATTFEPSPTAPSAMPVGDVADTPSSVPAQN